MLLRLLISYILIGLVFGRNIHIDIKAPWSQFSTSPIVSIAEFLHEQSTSIYWSYIDLICNISDPQIDLINSNQDNIKSIAVDIASSLLPKSTSLFLNTYLDIGYYLPANEMYYSIQRELNSPCEQGNSFILASDGYAYLCGINQVNEYITNYTTTTDTNNELSSALPDEINIEIDRIYPSKHTNKSPHIPKLTLYGSIGTHSFCQLHFLLRKLSDSGDIYYHMRHAFHTNNSNSSSSSTNDVNIQGYGVFLDIKNMEYKNIDDTKSSSSAAVTESSTSQHGDITGDEVNSVSEQVCMNHLVVFVVYICRINNSLIHM